jgi:hypothetical protein
VRELRSADAQKQILDNAVESYAGNLAALRILETEAGQQHQAVVSAQKS